MPVIVYKEIDVTMRWAQIRRIRCMHCGGPFSYVASARQRFTTIGGIAVTTDASMREAFGRKVRSRLEAVARELRLGTARCPDCGRAQPWMVSRVVLRAAGWGALLAVAAVCPANIAATQFGSASDAYWNRMAAAWAVLGLATAAVAWLWSRRKLGRRGAPDARSMRDDQLTEFLADCGKGGTDPALRWWFERVARRPAPPGLVLLSLGMDDSIGDFDVPEDLLTARRLARI